MGMDLILVPSGTKVEENGSGEKFDISGSATRTFLVTMHVQDQIEQESIDLSVWGSADGENWGAKPLLILPQQFYRGQTQLVLDISMRPEVKFIRAHWDLNRWGRVAPAPMFVIAADAREIPAMPKRHGVPAGAGPHGAHSSVPPQQP
ncbi:MAG TPA: hypothetical protein VFO34_00715 [Candidatus Acidoferrales bacterium]|nr:hypothetical protein [Candidatus Acidoferrales bacterium]